MLQIIMKYSFVKNESSRKTQTHASFSHQNFLQMLLCKMAHGNYNPVIGYYV